MKTYIVGYVLEWCLSDSWPGRPIRGKCAQNVTHTSSAAMYVGMVDMQTFLPWPCQMMFHRYDVHVA